MDYVLARLADPFVSPLVPGQRLYWLYICTALVLAFCAFMHKRSDGEGPLLKRFLRFCFPRSVFLHKSARLDYRYFIVNRILFGLLWLPIVASLSVGAATGVEAWLDGLIPGWAGTFPETRSALIAQTLATALAMDFGLFIAHYLQHRVPLLWEFHKVHHSAQVLTPVTAYRMHPVDDLLGMSLAGLMAGGVVGAFSFLQPGNPGPITVWGVGVVLFVFYAAGYNLRHSHVWLSYGPALGSILISPAQHQIHHSKAPQHWGRNLGFIFAFWDRWFGTLYIPREREPVAAGLADREDEEYSTVGRLYFLPFRKGASSFARRASVAVLATLLVALSAQGMLVAAAMVIGGGDHGPPRLEPASLAALRGTSAPPDALALEDLTWVEAASLIAAGYRTAIVPTGGTEQNGPHMVLGKHNYIVARTAQRIGRALGKTLIAPVIAYVPEGSISPPSGHMRFPGTISVSERTFEAILMDTARSLKAHGFRLICFLGDSGGNQQGQRRVAERLNREWHGTGVRVLQVGDYYFANAQAQWLHERGETAASIGRHAGIRDSSELMFVHPAGIRSDLLRPRIRSAVTGVNGDPSRASAERGRALLELKVKAAVRQIKEERSRMGLPGDSATGSAVSAALQTAH